MCSIINLMSAICPTSPPQSSPVHCCSVDSDNPSEDRADLQMSTAACSPQTSAVDLVFQRARLMVFPTSPPKLAKAIYPASSQYSREIYEYLAEEERDCTLDLVQSLQKLETSLEVHIESVCVRDLNKRHREIRINLPTASALLRRRTHNL